MTIEHRLASNTALKKETNRASFTAGPWRSCNSGSTMNGYSQPVVIIQENQPNLIAGIFGDVKGGEETCRKNAKLLTASANSYMANCKDPVEAAELDLLSSAISLIRRLVDDQSLSKDRFCSAVAFLDKAKPLP